MLVAPRNQGELICDAVDWFAREMRRKLFENMEKGGWRRCGTGYLIERLYHEIEELKTKIVNGAPQQEIEAEAADVANFAMMIADPGRG